MTTQSSRLIFKISYFTISASELVLRNKVRFVTRVRNVNNCTVALLVIVLFDACFLIALLASVLCFFPMALLANVSRLPFQ